MNRPWMDYKLLEYLGRAAGSYREFWTLVERALLETELEFKDYDNTKEVVHIKEGETDLYMLNPALRELEPKNYHWTHFAWTAMKDKEDREFDILIPTNERQENEQRPLQMP